MMQYLPPEIAGFFLGTLLITVLGSGAGLALSISSILNNDLLSRFVRPSLSGQLTRSHCLDAFDWIVGLSQCERRNDSELHRCFDGTQSFSNFGSSYFCHLGGRLCSASFALVACVCGPAVFFILRIAEVPVNALASSIAVGFGIMIVGWLMGKKKCRLTCAQDGRKKKSMPSLRLQGRCDSMPMLQEISVVENLREELLSALRVRLVEEFFRGKIFDHFAGVHEDHVVGHLLGKAHFVGDDHHGHAFVGEFDHHVEHSLIIRDQAPRSARQRACTPDPWQAHGRWPRAAAGRPRAARGTFPSA